MKSLLKMTLMEAKLFLREPASAFFTLVFPLGMLFLFGAMFGNEPSAALGGLGTIDIAIPAYTAMIIATVGLMNITIVMATYREKGILRRLATTPVRPLVILSAQLIVVLGMTALGMLLLILAGVLVYHIQFSGNYLSMAAGFLFSSLSFFGLGFILAGLMPTARAAQIVGMLLLYPMLFLSGATYPRELLPETINRIATYLPLTYVVNLLRGLWVGEAWSLHGTDILVLGVFLAGGVAVSALTFRWE